MKALLILIALTSSAAADEPHQQVAVITAIDPTFATGVAYGRDVAVRGRDVALAAELRVPWFVLDGHHYRVDLGARTTALGAHALRLLGELHLSVAGGKNWIHTSTGLGVEARAVGGWFRPRWYVAGELGFRADTLTYLVHSDLYRTTQFSDAVDGWYLGTGAWLTVAIEGGYRITPRWDVALRAGRTATATLRPPQGLPWLADLTVARRF